MGYNISIGNAVLEYEREDLLMRIVVESAEHDDAPNHCEFTKKGNYRSPGYSAWADFCREAGREIVLLFYGNYPGGPNRGTYNEDEQFHRETAFLCHHPGCEPICVKDLELIRAARIRREATNGGKPPGFWECSKEVDNGTDATLARLLWLEFWFDWALRNCERPAIANS